MHSLGQQFREVPNCRVQGQPTTSGMEDLDAVRWKHELQQKAWCDGPCDAVDLVFGLECGGVADDGLLCRDAEYTDGKEADLKTRSTAEPERWVMVKHGKWEKGQEAEEAAANVRGVSPIAAASRW